MQTFHRYQTQMISNNMSLKKQLRKLFVNASLATKSKPMHAHKLNNIIMQFQEKPLCLCKYINEHKGNSDNL